MSDKPFDPAEYVQSRGWIWDEIQAVATLGLPEHEITSLTIAYGPDAAYALFDHCREKYGTYRVSRQSA